ncbi:MAG: hypothetical protein C5B59_09735 [Bacteroidetes bacterium]|nr:MAG: hypothetical protein C5B59_09735 [Bacteroidota bacterium]
MNSTSKYLLTLALLFTCFSVCAQITYETVYVDYDSAWQYKNLKVIPIRPKKGFGGPLSGIVSLSQAIAQGLATVSERGTASTENVHYLRISNHSDKSVFISSGELMAGGRQDRMMAKDTILAPTGKDQYVPVMCVEEGRWSDKEKKFVYSNYANNHLRKVLDQNKNQVLIWKEVGTQLGNREIKNKTLAYLSRNFDKKVVLANDEYFHFFQNKFRQADSTIIGFVCISGDRVIGCDIFGSIDLFYGQLEPLLKGYTDEAVFFGGPVTMPEKEIKEYMDKLLSSEKSQEEFVKYNGKIFRQDGRIIHINTF